MTLQVFRDHDQGAAFVLILVTTPICTLATGLRFLASKRSGRKNNVLEDVFAGLSLAFFLVFCFMFLYLMIKMNGRSLQELALLPPEELIHILKIGWIMSPQYVPNQVFTKMTLVFLYFRIFSADEVFVKWLYGLGILQVMWGIAVYIVKFNLCSPIEFTWDKSVVGGTCIEIGPFLAASETINSLIDFAMIGLAIWIVRSLRMGRGNKIKLAVLFAVGGLSGVIGFIKIAEAYGAAYNNIRSPIWDIVQMASSIICCCAPIYKPLILELGIVKALRSTFGSSAHGSGSGGSGFSKKSAPKPPRWNGNRWTGGGSKEEDTHMSWVRIGGSNAPSSSKEELAWKAEVYGAPYDGSNPPRGAQADGYPMRTLEVRQNVEMV
ncbi:hypothetical protein V8F33_009820 [Rhypophila sp. PSN 637]